MTATRTRSPFDALLPILLVSGACSLVYQVVWLRLLRLVFGASTEASAAVVAVFMAGLGLGGWWFGRRTRDLDRPLRLYARLEAGIALGAAATLLLIAVVRSVYVGVGGESALGFATTPIRWLATVLVLGLPTLLMGGTLPVAVHAVEQRADIGRRRVAWLYGINTLGAVGGALLANFVLIEQLGVSRTLWLAAACNLLLAVVASRIARSAVEQTADEPPTDLDVPETTPRPAPAGSVDLPRRTLLVVAALVGFVFFVMELVWYRMLAPILGGSTYTMGLILAIALAGIGIGGWFYALGRRDRRPTVATLATTCGLEALVLAIPFALGDTLALATVFVRDLSALGFLGLVASWALIAMIVVFPAALLAGYQFPLLVGLLGAGDQGAGDDVGTAYAWNTAGAIVGSLAGGFGLLPLLGAPTLWRGAVGVLVVTSLWLAWTARTGQRSMRRELPTVPWIAAVLATLVTVGSVGPTAFWRHVPIGAGRAEVGDLATPNAWTAYRREVAWATRYEADGRESSIALQVVDDPALMVNGKSDGSGRGDATTTVLSGVIGASLHPDPERALVIGLGLGATAGFFTTVDSIERVDVVELEPAVVDVARQVGPLGYDVLDDPKTVLHLGDGRELVATSEQQWDLIFSEPSNPYRAGVADLFSRDFYRSVARRLRDGGLFLQWLQAYEIDPELVRTVYASIGDAFPVVETWQVDSADLLLVASAEPVPHDPARLAERLASPTFDHALRRVAAVTGLPGLYSGYVGGPALAARLGDGVAASTDDHPIIEFRVARTVGRQQWTPIGDLLTVARQLGVERPPGLDEATWSATLDSRQLRRARGTAFAHEPSEPSSDRRLIEARAAGQRGDLRRAALLWPELGPPSHHGDRLFLAEALAEAAGGPDAAPSDDESPIDVLPSWLTTVASEDQAAGHALTARLAWRRGDAEIAIDALIDAFDTLRTDAWSDLGIASRALDLAAEIGDDPRAASRLHAALAEPFAAFLLDEKRTVARAFLLARAGDFAEHCLAFFDAQEPHVLWVRPILESRLRCYRHHEDPRADRAWRDIVRYLDQAPVDFLIAPPSPGGTVATR